MYGAVMQDTSKVVKPPVADDAADAGAAAAGGGADAEGGVSALFASAHDAADDAGASADAGGRVSAPFVGARYDAPERVEGPRRIAVIGRAGAGKTTVALALGAAFGLPVVHLDRLAWGPGWRLEPPDVLAAREAAVIAGDRWVIDGGYLSSPSFATRAARADLIVQADAPLIVCLWRIARRAFAARRGSLPRRPDLPDGCEEELPLEFIFWTVTWSRRTRKVRAALAARDAQDPVVDWQATPVCPAASFVMVRGAADAVARVRSIWAMGGEAQTRQS